METPKVKSIRRDDGTEVSGLLIEMENGMFYVCEIKNVTTVPELAVMLYNDLVKTEINK